MKEYVVEITETLQRQIKVIANNEEEAIDKVEEMYRNEDIILDAEDLVGSEINIIPEGE